MYRKFRNIPIFKDFPLICHYFLGFRVGRYVTDWYSTTPKRELTLKRKFTSGIEGALALKLNRDFNWKQLSKLIICIFF